MPLQLSRRSYNVRGLTYTRRRKRFNSRMEHGRGLDDFFSGFRRKFDSFINSASAYTAPLAKEALKALPELLGLGVGAEAKPKRTRKAKGGTLQNFGGTLQNFGSSSGGGNSPFIQDLLDQGITKARRKAKS